MSFWCRSWAVDVWSETCPRTLCFGWLWFSVMVSLKISSNKSENTNSSVGRYVHTGTRVRTHVCVCVCVCTWVVWWSQKHLKEVISTLYCYKRQKKSLHFFKVPSERGQTQNAKNSMILFTWKHRMNNFMETESTSAIADGWRKGSRELWQVGVLFGAIRLLELGAGSWTALNVLILELAHPVVGLGAVRQFNG